MEESVIVLYWDDKHMNTITTLSLEISISDQSTIILFGH